MLEVCGKAVDKPLPLLIVRKQGLYIGTGVCVVGFAAVVNPSANHAHTGPVAQNVVGSLCLNPAYHAYSAAVELCKGVANRAQDPQFRPLVLRVPLGHSKAPGTDGAGYHHLALCHGIAHTVGGVTKYCNFRADIQIAHIVRGGTVADDLGARRAHAAETLTARTLDMDFPGPVLTLQTASNIVLAVCFKYQFIGFCSGLLHHCLKIL